MPPLLILGETGTGKGLLVRIMHQLSIRRDMPLIEVNCAAIPENLVEAELFGFERGAFTDARQAKPGLFQAAHRGVLFLDEVGSLPPAIQAKLLTALEQREVRRLGSTRSEPVDVWIFSATNEDLSANVARGAFRLDLYHRISTVKLQMPPLLERGRDVITLAGHFLKRAYADYALTPSSRRATRSPRSCSSFRCPPAGRARQPDRPRARVPRPTRARLSGRSRRPSGTCPVRRRASASPATRCATASSGSGSSPVPPSPRRARPTACHPPRPLPSAR
jgi:sigma54-dependent transcription regulator